MKNIVKVGDKILKVTENIVAPCYIGFGEVVEIQSVLPRGFSLVGESCILKSADLINFRLLTSQEARVWELANASDYDSYNKLSRKKGK